MSSRGAWSFTSRGDAAPRRESLAAYPSPVNTLHPPLHAVRDTVARALAEDLGPLGDLTAALLPEDATGRASFVSRKEGVIAGALCVNETYAQLDADVKLTWLADDGVEVSADECVARIEGPLGSILTRERTAPQLLSSPSGVATVTRRFVRATHGQARIWDTRKTTPGLR